jgi:hypothetical protein
MLRAMRALVETAKDVAGVKKAIAKIAKTPGGWATVFDIAIDPPKLRFPVGTSFIAMSAIKRAYKKSAEVQELLIARCAKADLDAEVWELPLLLLSLLALADKSRALGDKRVLAGLRRTLASQSEDLSTNAAFVLTRLPDHGSLREIVAMLDRASARDGHLVSRVAEAMMKLRGATAKDLAKLEAARARLRDVYWGAKIDKQIARIAKRF